MRTLRFWTDRGLLQARRAENSYRIYSPHAPARVAFIRNAQGLGLTLEAIARLLDLSDAEVQSCPQVQEVWEKQLGAVQARIAELQLVEQTLLARLQEVGHRPCDNAGCRYLPPPLDVQP